MTAVNLSPYQHVTVAVGFPIHTRILVAVAGVAAVTACGSTQTVAAHPSPKVSASSSSALSSPPSFSNGTGTTGGSPMACGTVVDPDPAMNGFKASSLTAQQVISYLEAMMLADGVVNLPAGNLTDTDITILTGAGQDLENYHGDKLADDGEQYYQDEQSYNPSGPVDTSYASALVTDIGALEKDCPGALKEALKIDNRP